MKLEKSYPHVFVSPNYQPGFHDKPRSILLSNCNKWFSKSFEIRSGSVWNFILYFIIDYTATRFWYCESLQYNDEISLYHSSNVLIGLRWLQSTLTLVTIMMLVANKWPQMTYLLPVKNHKLSKTSQSEASRRNSHHSDRNTKILIMQFFMVFKQFLLESNCV